jgi:hypothetical protein
VSRVVASAPLWQRLLILAPAFVIGGGLVLAVLIVLARGMAQTMREVGHPRLFYAGFVALIAVVALLTYLGVQLPRE